MKKVTRHAWLAALTLVGFLSAGCATLPPQSNPVTVDPFVGVWSGTWVDSRNPHEQGWVLVFINSTGEGFAVLSRPSSGRRVDHVTLSLKNGALWHEGRGIEMRLHGADRLEAIHPHDWRPWPSAALWSLRRVSESEARARVEAWKRNEDRRAHERSWLCGTFIGRFAGCGRTP